MRYAIERQQMIRKLEASRKWERHLVYYDTLTNLPNRSLFYDRLERAIAHARRNGQTVAVLFIDLDEFKRINDALGHSKGDILLQIVSRNLKKCIRESDTIARLGGDEFTVVLENVDQAHDAVRVAKKILERLSGPLSIGGVEVCVTGSIGISLFPSDATDVESLVKYADVAMYYAKGKGKNNYHLFSPSMDIPGHKRLLMAEAMRHAVESDEFVIHYQPQVSLITGTMTGAEALLRWNYPSVGVIPPAEFIPLAEETGIIVRIGKWLLRTVCEQNKAWQKAGLKPIKVAVNLSARQFSSKGLIQNISQTLAATGLEPKFLELEITESCAMQDLEYTVATLQILKEKGVQLAVDDFGTGYSSMGNLKYYPVDVLKIDRAFIKNLPTDRDNAAITTAIIAMAHSLGKRTIAEGVETEAQATFLRSISCDEMQGYHFSRPVSSEAIEKLLQEKTNLTNSEILKYPVINKADWR